LIDGVSNTPRPKSERGISCGYSGTEGLTADFAAIRVGCAGKLAIAKFGRLRSELGWRLRGESPSSSALEEISPRTSCVVGYERRIFEVDAVRRGRGEFGRAGRRFSVNMEDPKLGTLFVESLMGFPRWNCRGLRISPSPFFRPRCLRRKKMVIPPKRRRVPRETETPTMMEAFFFFSLRLAADAAASCCS
jgi:hypothetical protein